MRMFLAFCFLTWTLTACATSKPMFVDKTITRDIPLSLFTGFAEGETEKVHYQSTGNPIKVSGPIDWKHPQTGNLLKVYKRDRQTNRSGLIEQVFVIRKDGQGIGRVWDSRRPKEYADGSVKFPLSEWYQGEKRTFQTSRGRMTIEIMDLFNGADKQSIQFKWSFENYDCNVYTYGFQRGMLNSYNSSCSEPASIVQ